MGKKGEYRCTLIEFSEIRSISPYSPWLVSYFTNLLCRQEKISTSGRTLTAISIGLGDESVGMLPHANLTSDQTHTILVYGQKSDSSSSSLKLVVGRRKPIIPPEKVRPGEPLPRAPLFFPIKAPKKPPPPIPRAFSRAPSVSIYAPPPRNTPGRRGEKRHHEVTTDERKRKAGRIVPTLEKEKPEEDIFGKRPLKAASMPSILKITNEDPMSDVQSDPNEPSSSKKRVRVPQQVLDNKAVSVR
jgi:hypothetical protein